MSEYINMYQAGPADRSGDIQFRSRLEYRDFAENLWEYIAPFQFIYKGVAHAIPQHFITDFYSVPRFLRWLWPNNQGVYNESSGIHDWFVRNRKLLGMSLTECHRAFNAAMSYQGVPDARRRMKFAAVYLFNGLCAGKGDGSLPDHIVKAVERRRRTGINYRSMGC